MAETGSTTHKGKAPPDKGKAPPDKRERIRQWSSDPGCSHKSRCLRGAASVRGNVWSGRRCRTELQREVAGYGSCSVF